MKNNFSIRFCSGALSAFVALVISLSGKLFAAEGGQVYSTPEEAVKALGQAVSTTNRTALGQVLGPASQELVNPDEVQGASELAEFTAAFKASNRLARESDTRMTLEVGTNGWPFPIPLTKSPNGWQFDTAAGLEELLNRRVGRNELDVLDVIRAYVEAQREYASRDRDGDDVLEYAMKLASSPGRTDGLYWPLELNGDVSPFGPLVAEAQGEGYLRAPATAEAGPRPFHGYLFKILTRQGRNAAGGRYDYVINGNMIGGFALVAWPVAYGDSGVMTFIVNQRGRIYQRDLGKNTSKLAEKMKEYDPDASWQISAD